MLTCLSPSTATSECAHSKHMLSRQYEKPQLSENPKCYGCALPRVSSGLSSKVVLQRMPAGGFLPRVPAWEVSSKCCLQGDNLSLVSRLLSHSSRGDFNFNMSRNIVVVSYASLAIA